MTIFELKIDKKAYPLLRDWRGLLDAIKIKIGRFERDTELKQYLVSTCLLAENDAALTILAAKTELNPGETIFEKLALERAELLDALRGNFDRETAKRRFGLDDSGSGCCWRG